MTSFQSQLLFLSVQDPAASTHYKYNEEKSVSVWTKHGRNKVSVSEHVELLRAFRPNVFECLYDSAPSRGNKMKRVRKEEGGGRKGSWGKKRPGGGWGWGREGEKRHGSRGGGKRKSWGGGGDGGVIYMLMCVILYVAGREVGEQNFEILG